MKGSGRSVQESNLGVRSSQGAFRVQRLNPEPSTSHILNNTTGFGRRVQEGDLGRRGEG
jgi:hypothetical protein